jgi:uncharacterized protein YciI
MGDVGNGRQHWLAICRDGEGSLARRRLTLDAHRRFVDQRANLIAFSGPLVADDGDTRIGQVYALQVEDRAEAEEFMRADPFSVAGVFSTVEISRMLPKFRDGERRELA